MRSIVFTGGGSAGHVVPNIALIMALLTEKKTITYIGSKEGIERELISRLPIPYYAISSGKLRRYFSLKNFLDPFKVLLGVFQAWRILGKIKPDVVFSKGGFVAFPVVFGAWLRRIPVVAHESDLTPGLANRLSFPFVKKIAVTFEDTLKESKEKVVVTGTPIRESLFRGNATEGRKLCGFDNEKPCLLVIGGGSGASAINNTVREALPELLKHMNVIHCCGKGKMSVFSLDHPSSALRAPSPTRGEGKHSGSLGIYKQFEYVNEELPHLYACSDMILSRAGANTVYEILALKKVAIYVPLSLGASRGDQIANARFLASKGLCAVLDESAMTAETLAGLVQKTFEEREKIQEKLHLYGITSGTDAIIHLINEVSCE